MVQAIAKRKLRWSGKCLNDDDARVVGFIIAHSLCLTDLDLGGNAITDVGAIAIAEGIMQTHAPLATVVLGPNKIGDAGAAALGEALRISRAPLDLRLHFNPIGDVGATAIAKGLAVANAPVHQAVHTLWLSSNKIGPIGAAAIGVSRFPLRIAHSDACQCNCNGHAAAGNTPSLPKIMMGVAGWVGGG